MRIKGEKKKLEKKLQVKNWGEGSLNTLPEVVFSINYINAELNYFCPMQLLFKFKIT